MAKDIDRIDFLEKELDRLLGWGRAAESRLGLVLPLSTAMLGALAVLAPPTADWTILGAVSVSFAALLLVLSVAFSACAAFPRTSGPKGSLIYFGAIVHMDAQQYAAALQGMSPDDYRDDLTQQCHRNAQIADRKFVWIQRSMACLFIGALPWSVGLFTLYTARS